MRTGVGIPRAHIKARSIGPVSVAPIQGKGMERAVRIRQIPRACWVIWACEPSESLSSGFSEQSYLKGGMWLRTTLTTGFHKYSCTQMHVRAWVCGLCVHHMHTHAHSSLKQTSDSFVNGRETDSLASAHLHHENMDCCLRCWRAAQQRNSTGALTGASLYWYCTGVHGDMWHSLRVLQRKCLTAPTAPSGS